MEIYIPTGKHPGSVWMTNTLPYWIPLWCLWASHTTVQHCVGAIGACLQLTLIFPMVSFDFCVSAVFTICGTENSSGDCSLVDQPIPWFAYQDLYIDQKTLWCSKHIDWAFHTIHYRLFTVWMSEVKSINHWIVLKHEAHFVATLAVWIWGCIHGHPIWWVMQTSPAELYSCVWLPYHW